jgi:hypothetical protein
VVGCRIASIDEFNRWAAPLNDGIARGRTNLSVLPGRRTATALANAAPAMRV